MIWKNEITNIETFDLIGFHSAELTSNLVKYLEKRNLVRKYKQVKQLPEISHVGLAVHGKDLLPFKNKILRSFATIIDDNDIYVFESTCSDSMFNEVPDVFGKYYEGVQLRCLKELKNNFIGDIYWSPKRFELDKHNLKRLARCIRDLNYKPYTYFKTNVADMKVFSRHSYFGPELVAHCLQACGILNHKVWPKYILPLDFYIDPTNPTITLDVDNKMPILYENPVNLRDENLEIVPTFDSVDGQVEVNIKSLDLLGFKGIELISHLVSYLQLHALKQKYRKLKNLPNISHVGLAVQGKDLLSYGKKYAKPFRIIIQSNEIYVFESTCSGTMFDKVKDVFGKYYFGVQLRSLTELKRNYPGAIYWSSKLFDIDKDQIKRFVKCIEDLNYKPYEKSLNIMLSNVFSCISTNSSTPNSFFCSELVAHCLKRCDVLTNKEINSEKVVPLDFYINPLNPSETLDIDGEIPILYKNPIPLNV